MSALERAAAKGAPRAKLVAPLDNGRIEALAKRGKEKMIIQRALAVAVQNHSPLAYVLGPGGVNKPLLNSLWKQTQATMQKETNPSHHAKVGRPKYFGLKCVANGIVFQITK